MLIKIVINCLVDGYLGLCARRIFVAVHGVDFVLCECVVCRCRGDLHVVCFKFSLIGILDACLRGIFVNGATFDSFWVMAAAWVNFLAGWTWSDRCKILCVY